MVEAEDIQDDHPELGVGVVVVQHPSCPPVGVMLNCCPHVASLDGTVICGECVVCIVFSVSRPGWDARIMRWCGLEQVLFCSNSVPTSDRAQPSPRLWVPNPYS